METEMVPMEPSSDAPYQKQALQLLLQPATLSFISSALMLMLRMQGRVLRALAAFHKSRAYGYMIAMVHSLCWALINVYAYIIVYIIYPTWRLFNTPSRVTRPEIDDSDDSASVTTVDYDETFIPSVVELHEDYESRQYEAAYWISTRVTGRRHNAATREGGNRLLQYAEGYNQDRVVFEIDTPLVTRISSCSSDQPCMEYIVSARLPQNLQANPPKSCCKDVHLQMWPDFKVLARRFSGFTTDEIWLTEAETLLGTILDKEKFDPSHYYTVVFGNPFTIMHQRSEIWFEQKQVNTGFGGTVAGRTAGNFYNSAVNLLNSWNGKLWT